jgi:hypothetical protein
MSVDSKFALKLLSPQMVIKAMQTFDRATTVVVSMCWGAAAFVMAAAIYTLMLSVSARHEADNALIAEPSLPKVIHQPMDIRGAQKVFDRMQRRFPDITFSVRGKDLLVASTDGTKFHQWLTALSYVDTISPEFHWSINEFCVGRCANMEIMHAAMTGDHISFEVPEGNAKN